MESGVILTWAGVDYPQEFAVGPPSRGGHHVVASLRDAKASFCHGETSIGESRSRVAPRATPAESPFFGQPADDHLQCATDPFEDFDDDDFDDEFDDDFEEEWDEELPGDADQFEPDEKEADEDGVEVEPDFEDED